MTLLCHIEAGSADADILAALARDITAELARQGSRRHLEQAKSLYRARRLRQRFFDGRGFREPAWDMLIDLFIASEEGRDVSVSSACIAANAPLATALRHLNALVAMAYLERVPHGDDGRSTLVRLTPRARRMMVAYFDEIVPN